MKKGRRAQSAPVRRPPPPHHPPSFATKDKVSNKQHTSLNATNTSYSIPTLKVPQQQQQHKNNFSSSISFSSRSSRSTRDTLLDDFTTKFVKTRNELNARNQQCELLALEIEKYKKELIGAHEILYSFEQDEAALREKYDNSKLSHSREMDYHKTLTQELTQARKEKQDRIKERMILAQEFANHQLLYKQIYEENMKSEEQARLLSKKLQGVNRERLKFRQECIENQTLIDEYNAQLDKLQNELKEMRDVVSSSIGESLHHSNISDFTSNHNFSTTTNNPFGNVFFTAAQRIALVGADCPTPANFSRLQTYIESAVAAAGYCDWIEWGVTDFGSNTILSANADLGIESASSIKLYVLIAVLQDVQNGLYSLSDNISCSGQNACLELMIGISDNCATYDNIVKTTMKHVNLVMVSLGMKNSTLHHWCPSTCPGYVDPCPNDDGTELDNTLAARDVITALTALYDNVALSPMYTKQAYQYLLTAHGWTPMLSMYPPVPVAHKQGWLPASEGFNPLTENDEAIVFACNPFAVVVLTQQTWTNPNSDNAALALGAQIGRLAYCTFDTTGVATDGQACSTTWKAASGPGCSTH